MDRAGAPAFVHPLSPVSSHSDLSLDELTFSVKPLPQPPTESGEGEQLPPLQVANGKPEGLEPVGEDELDPGSFDLVMPGEQDGSERGQYELEQRSELLFSGRHLRAIFDDPAELYRFSGFLYQHRPASVPLLTYYLEATKALRAISYSNSVLRKLGPLTDYGFTHDFFQAQPTANQELQTKADTAFEVLAREDLPMYVTHVWIHTVTVSIRHRIMGSSSHAADGLCETFCLTDPSRSDNPIVFTSRQFHYTTQYGLSYVIGRNCRFLQGPYTNPFSVSRIRDKLEAGREHFETFLNYRRDGSPFMNLLMLAPLYDSRGQIRYVLGAQIDCTALATTAYGLNALKRLVEDGEADRSDSDQSDLSQLVEVFDPQELETARERGGRTHRAALQRDGGGGGGKRTTKGSSVEIQSCDLEGEHRVVLRDSDSPPADDGPFMPPQTIPSGMPSSSGRLTGVYENYLLVRPMPSLRILFASPSMRVPGLLLSPLLDKIGGSGRIRDQLVQALADGQSVTAKVKWLSGARQRAAACPPRKKMHYNHPLEAHLDLDDAVPEPEPAGRLRWLHCTPLVGANNKVGVWMIVIVDDDAEPGASTSTTTTTITTTTRISKITRRAPARA
ncbi:hypothetical protein CDD83_9758 [Cordyceps sp. RAO-2017]|nr:hypothetical protein CDD83_9758 [Cordyceps sp. RAO-2017]